VAVTEEESKVPAKPVDKPSDDTQGSKRKWKVSKPTKQADFIDYFIKCTHLWQTCKEDGNQQLLSWGAEKEAAFHKKLASLEITSANFDNEKLKGLK
jgi:hypothetical protein